MRVISDAYGGGKLGLDYILYSKYLLVVNQSRIEEE